MSIIGNLRYRYNTPTAQYKQTGIGELSSLGTTPYNYSTYRYPQEGLGDTDAPHYILFNINIPQTARYNKNDKLGGIESPAAAGQSASTADFDYRAAQGTLSNAPATGQGEVIVGLSTGKELIDSKSPFDAAVAGLTSAIGVAAVQNAITIRPQLKRIATSVALYMPDSQLTASYDHDWGTVDLTTALGLAGISSAFSGQLIKNLNFEGIKNIITNIIGGDNNGHVFTGNLFNKTGLGAGQRGEASGFLGELTGVTGPGSTALTLRSQNRALNPQVQMVFRGTSNREYIFEFDLQSRSSQETQMIQDIILTFKKYAAPELAPEGNGRYFIPPAQFDIKFFFKNNENPFLAKISTCALVGITVDYNRSPPFASFTDGAPVHVWLQLRFKEMDIITRELIEKFGY